MTWEIVTKRLWARVKKSDTCWEWQGYRDKDGYGKVRFNGRDHPAHRISWMLHIGRMAAQCVLHRCDNPPCVNPKHLFEGTRQDNNRDMFAKGRANCGGFRSKKTKCPRGHEYSGDNLYLHPGRKARDCRTCRKATNKKRAAIRHRAKLSASEKS